MRAFWPKKNTAEDITNDTFYDEIKKNYLFPGVNQHLNVPVLGSSI